MSAHSAPASSSPRRSSTVASRGGGLTSTVTAELERLMQRRGERTSSRRAKTRRCSNACVIRRSSHGRESCSERKKPMRDAAPSSASSGSATCFAIRNRRKRCSRMRENARSKDETATALTAYVRRELRYMSSDASREALERLLEHDRLDVRCVALDSLGERLRAGVVSERERAGGPRDGVALRLAATHPLQPLARLRVELVANLAHPVLAVRHLLQIVEEGLRRHLLRREAGGPANGAVGRDDDDVLALAMLRRETFEERVRMFREADLQRPVGLVGTDAVEDEDPTRTFDGDEARELVAERPAVRVATGVEQVVAVEQVQRRLRHGVGGPPRRAARRRRR